MTSHSVSSSRRHFLVLAGTQIHLEYLQYTVVSDIAIRSKKEERRSFFSFLLSLILDCIVNLLLESALDLFDPSPLWIHIFCPKLFSHSCLLVTSLRGEQASAHTIGFQSNFKMEIIFQHKSSMDVALEDFAKAKGFLFFALTSVDQKPIHFPDCNFVPSSFFLELKDSFAY